MSFLRWVIFALALSLFTARAEADSLTTTDGKKIVGKLVAVDGQSVTFASADGNPIKFPSKDVHLVDLEHPIQPIPKDVKFQELELTDGSTFRIAKLAIKGKQIVADLLPTPEGAERPSYEIGMGSVFSLMRGAEDAKSRETWKKFLASRGKRDLYVIREAGGLNFVSGTILGGNDAGDIISFEKEDGSKAELRLSRATGGLVFAQQPLAQNNTAACKVLDVFGNSLVAQSLVFGPTGATATTVSGAVVKYSTANSIAKLDFAKGNVAYLSDLDPSVDAPPIAPDEKGLRLNVVAPFIRDASVSKEPLRLGSETFSRGLCIAPDTKLTYDIGGDYREFRAVVGMQENSTDAELEAKLTIETDEGRILFSEVLKRKNKPKSIALDVKGVKQLRIVVEADLPVNGNRVILADVRVQK
jgi:hypothetical protein